LAVLFSPLSLSPAAALTCRAATVRPELDSRNQTRWLSADGPRLRRASVCSPATVTIRQRASALLAKPMNGINAPQRPDCVAGHVGLELRNVVANYPFESSRGFAGSKPNSGHGDHSRLSCGAGDTQLGPGGQHRKSQSCGRDVRAARRTATSPICFSTRASMTRPSPSIGAPTRTPPRAWVRAPAERGS
jgi:hypothetical protein